MAIIRQARFYFIIPSIFSIVCAYVFAGNYNPTQLFLVTTSFILVWVFMSSVNNTYDVATDNISRLMRDKNPVATGELTMREVHSDAHHLALSLHSDWSSCWGHIG